MRRTEWSRILEKEYVWDFCEWLGQSGIASALVIRKVTEPVTLQYEHGQVTIANEGDIWLQLALENDCIWTTAMFDRDHRLIQIYFDITNGNQLLPAENPTFEDLYLDVVMENEGTLHVLDHDELDRALEIGMVTQEMHFRACEACDKLCHYLSLNWQTFVSFCLNELERLLKKM